MKKLIFISLLISLITISIFAQTSQTPLNFTKIPSWVKPGITLVYQIQIGTGTRMGEDFSGASAQGYQIYAVTNIDKSYVYGISLLIVQSISSGYPSLSLSVDILNGKIFLDPKEVQDYVKKAKTAGLPPGLKYEFGPYGDKLYYFLIESSDYQSMERSLTFFDDKGMVQKSSMLEKQGLNSSTAGEMQLVGVYNLNMPNITTPPQAVKLSPTYQFYSSVSLFQGYTGMSAPLGMGRYSVASSMGTAFLIDIQGQVRKQALGNFYLGPYYIHPLLLKQNSIISIPQIGFSWNVVGNGQYGGLLTQITINGTPIAQFEYDPNTGLLLSATIPQGEGLYVSYFLVNR